MDGGQSLRLLGTTGAAEAPAAFAGPTVEVPVVERVAPRPRVPPEDSPVSPPVGVDATAVLPYVVSTSARYTRRLRPWMLLLPVDLVALLLPLAFSTRYWRGALAAAVLTVVFFGVGGLYHARCHMSILNDLPGLCGRLLSAAAVVTVIAAVRHNSVGYGADFMRGVALAAGLVISGRTLAHGVILVARRRRWVERNAIVIGRGPIGVELARMLRRNPRYGMRFAGYVDTAARHDTASAPLLSTLDDLAEVLAVVDCGVLIVADPDCADSVLMDIMRQPACAARDRWVVPRLWGSLSQGGLADHIGAIPVVQLGPGLVGPRWAIKRLFDVLFAAAALVVLSPLFLLCAGATLFDGGRSIFFGQERIGRDGKSIRIIKFRSMRPVDEEESRTNWSIAHDRRVRPIGRFLRRTSLDELPQLWNVLRGDMTVVGPRPERPYFVEQFTAQYPHYGMRHRIPPGMTGLAQVSGLRGDTPIADRARFDNYYIENWSLWLDIKVMLRTVAEVLRGRGR